MKNPKEVMQSLTADERKLLNTILDIEKQNLYLETLNSKDNKKIVEEIKIIIDKVSMNDN